MSDPALPTEAAADGLHTSAGIRYDSQAVDACPRLVDDGFAFSTVQHRRRPSVRRGATWAQAWPLHLNPHVTRRLAFAYFMKDRPRRIREIAPYHIEYWRDIQDARCIAGPFADRCGGLILFDAASHEEAASVVEHDPFAVHALLAHWWVKEWIAESWQPL